MSDTEQHKKRKLDEVAEGAAAASETPAATTTSAESSADSNNVLLLQLAQEKQRIVKLLEPFAREQLIAILASAASQYSNIFNEIKAVASTDVVHRKIFVRGLAWEATSETLQDAFSTFGAVEEAAVIYDKATSKSKGYGFVTFVDMDAAQRAVEQQTIDINGRRATCNLAAMRANADEHHQPAGSSHDQHHSHQQQQSHRAGAAPQQQLYAAPSAAPQQQMYAPAPASNSSGYSDESERKLFVRGLSWNTTDDMFYAEFVKYGDLDEAMIARDRATGKSKGFGFITFKHKASADLALQQPQKIIDGRTTTCNLASQGGSRAGGGGGNMGGYGNMTPVMPAPVPTYAMPMYAAMPGQYAPQQMQQAPPVQYGAYPAMADPYHAQSYGAPAPQYYQNRPPPGQQPPTQR